MIDLRPIAFVIGILLAILALAMLIPASVDAAIGHPDWQVFTAAAGVTLFIGGALILTSRSGWSGFTLRQGFIMTNLAWLVTATFGALPFAFSELELSYTDALFESMSGVTTTSTWSCGARARAPRAHTSSPTGSSAPSRWSTRVRRRSLPAWCGPPASSQTSR